MERYRKICREMVLEALKRAADEKGWPSEGLEEKLSFSLPPRPEVGDLAFPMFPFAKGFRLAPPVIAQAVVEAFEGKGLCRAVPEGPYLNIFLTRPAFVERTCGEVFTEADRYGCSSLLEGQKIMIEFSSPNTNKPLHLGHLRNNALGESISRILQASGAEIYKVNLVNDRGIHICKSMLAYQKMGQGVSPESTGRKSDHLVGDFYVKYNEWAKEDSTAEEQAQEMLRLWEEGDPEVRKLWARMNHWVLEGIKETYRKTNISFDRYYYESEVYLSGKDLVYKGLEEGVFYKAEDGSIRLDLGELHMDNKILLRSDGTSVYITQDLGTPVARHEDFPFDRLIYVVGAEQEYHFKVLFYALGKLGYPWATSLYHLSYGMVNLPEGKMKSREGTVVDADDLLEELTHLAKEEIHKRERVDAVEGMDEIAQAVALGALHYYLLQVSPPKDMTFNPRESLSFQGNTGSYLLYTAARINSLLEKLENKGEEYEVLSPGYELLGGDPEWELAKNLSLFPEVVREGAKALNPSTIATYLYELAKSFSHFYHNCPILQEENKALARGRIELARATLQVLKNGFALMNIPFLTRM